MKFYTIKHVTEESQHRVDNIVRQLGEGKPIPSHLAVVIRAVAMEKPYENFSYLGVWLESREQHNLEASDAVYITPMAYCLVRNFYKEFSSHTLRKVGPRWNGPKDNEVPLDLSAPMLPIFPARSNVTQEGKPRYVIMSNLMRTYAHHRMDPCLRHEHLTEEELDARCKQMLDHMYEVGFGDFSYPVERGVVIWSEQRISRSSSLNDDPRWRKKTPKGTLSQAQKLIKEQIMNLPADFDGMITIPFQHGKPGILHQKRGLYVRKV